MTFPQPVWAPVPATGAAPPVSITHTDNTFSGTDATNYTFTSRSIGTADSSRYIIVATGNVTNTGAPRTVSSMTIGGVSATQIVAVTRSIAGADTSVEMWFAYVPTGTTATVVINHSGSTLRCSIGVWAIYDVASIYDTDTETDAGDENLAMSLDCEADGGIIGFAYTTSGGTSFTWSGITEDFDANGESVTYYSGAHDEFASAQTGLTVQGNPSAASEYSAASVCAAFSPA